MDWPSIAVAVDRGRAGNEPARLAAARQLTSRAELCSAMLRAQQKELGSARSQLASRLASQQRNLGCLLFLAITIHPTCILFFKNTNTNLITVY